MSGLVPRSANRRSGPASEAGLPAEARVRRGGRHEGGSNSVVESQPSKLLVAGSIPVSRSSLRATLVVLAALAGRLRQPGVPRRFEPLA